MTNDLHNPSIFHPHQLEIESSVVTIIVAYRVKINCIIQFEEWIHEMARQASTRVSGFRGEVVCQTPLIVLEQDPNASFVNI